MERMYTLIAMKHMSYMEKYKKRRAEELKKPWAVSASKDAYWSVYHFIKDLPSTIKWKWQRARRGYSECDVWGLNGFIIEKLHKPIKAFVKYQAEHGHGAPVEFEKDPAGWLEVLYKIEYAFDQGYQEEVTYTDEFHEHLMEMLEAKDGRYEERLKKMQEGFELFGRFLQTMWD